MLPRSSADPRARRAGCACKTAGRDREGDRARWRVQRREATVARQLQQALREPYLHVGLDHFFSMFPYEWRDHPRGPGPGFWVDKTPDATGCPRAKINYGEAGARLLTGMRAAVNALLAASNNVILDEMPVDDSIMPAWHRELHASSTFWVRLTASLPVLEARERGRTTGQQLGNSRGHFDVSAGEEWDLVIDTDDLTPSETAVRIVAALGIPD